MTARMKPIFPTIWNVLHDGGIDRIVGSVPGNLQVHVGIEYLRELFPDDGGEIIVQLSGCRSFSFRLYDSENTITDLKAIADESLSILSAEMHNSICRVFADTGVLEMECVNGTVSLDSGREIAIDELLAVAEQYWDQWELKSSRDEDA